MAPSKIRNKLVKGYKLLPLQVSMKMIQAVHLILDKSENKGASSHSNFCTLTCSHQNLPLEL